MVWAGPAGHGHPLPARQPVPAGPPALEPITPNPVPHMLGQPPELLMARVGVPDVGDIAEQIPVAQPVLVVAVDVDGDGGDVVRVADIAEAHGAVRVDEGADHRWTPLDSDHWPLWQRLVVMMSSGVVTTSSTLAGSGGGPAFAVPATGRPLVAGHTVLVPASLFALETCSFNPGVGLPPPIGVMAASISLRRNRMMR
jgi:hypothetical protein